MNGKLNRRSALAKNENGKGTHTLLFHFFKLSSILAKIRHFDTTHFNTP